MEDSIDALHQEMVILRETVKHIHDRSQRKNLFVLDLNGQLADIVDSTLMVWTERLDITEIQHKIMFKRTFLEDFLQFCFKKFEVGIWISRSK